MGKTTPFITNVMVKPRSITFSFEPGPQGDAWKNMEILHVRVHDFRKDKFMTDWSNELGVSASMGWSEQTMDFKRRNDVAPEGILDENLPPWKISTYDAMMECFGEFMTPECKRKFETDIVAKLEMPTKLANAWVENVEAKKPTAPKRRQVKTSAGSFEIGG